MKTFPIRTALLALLALASVLGASTDDVDWRCYGKDPGFTHFSRLDQINKSNVGNLRVAWVHHTGHGDSNLKTTIECNPLVVNGTVYVTSPVLEVIALDGATGRQIWKYNPFPFEYDFLYSWPVYVFALLALSALVWALIRTRRRKNVAVAVTVQCGAAIFLLAGISLDPRHFLNPMNQERRQGPSRGLSYWESGSDKRILFAGGHHLIALNALTGSPIAGFGEAGSVDLTRGLGRNLDGQMYAVTTPGVVYKDLIIIGAKVGEGPLPAAPGDVRAFDVRTGEQKWIFHTIPHPGEPGYKTWPADTWKHVGGANPWGGMSLDPARGYVFVPTGSATFDFFGGDRAGMDLFADSVIALHADTGTLVWYYQTIHHNLWDYDLASPPNLVTVQRDGKPVDAVVQPSKSGFVFVLNRDTGTPLFPVEERPVPHSTLAGEQAWPTQPVPLKPPPLARTEITENDLTDITPQAHEFALREFRKAATARMYVPPSTNLAIVTPGFHGGANWSGSSVDPRTARLVVNSNDIPFTLRMKSPTFWQPYRWSFYGFHRFADQNGYPAIKPPWGKLTEIDLNTGNFVWQIPLGEYPELTAQGIPITGAENAGGSAITAGGLIFIGSTSDQRFRAFDVDTGKILWQTKLDAAAQAAPSTYSINGKQYVVTAAAGGSMVESPAGDEFVAFALQ